MTDIVEKIARQIGSNHLSTFFLNAPPGAGKTHLLSTLHESMPEIMAVSFSAKIHVMGPFTISNLDTPSFLNPLLDELKDSLFVHPETTFEAKMGFAEFLLAIKDEFTLTNNRFFLVLYDLQDAHKHPVKTLASIFSQLRALGEKWKDGNIRFSIIVSGSWDHHAMMEQFEEMQTSWSYIPGENYMTTQGVDSQAITNIVSQFGLSDKRIPYGEFLFNLCGGHPGCVREILEIAVQEGITFSRLLFSVDQAAQTGTNAKRLVEFWGNLSEESKSLIFNLLQQKYLSSPSILPPNLTRLFDLGILSSKTINERSYLSFRSWYIELVVRYHASELGFFSEEQLPELSELIPNSTAICAEGYNLVNEIENLVRNYVSAHLWSHKLSPADHPLKERLYKFSEEKGREEDAYERALDWKERNLRRKVYSSKLNPLIAFLSTISLADLVREIGEEINSPAWIDISNAIREMSGVRDAIMHNQIIDDSDLSMLYDIQEKVYKALSQ